MKRPRLRREQDTWDFNSAAGGSLTAERNKTARAFVCRRLRRRINLKGEEEKMDPVLFLLCRRPMQQLSGRVTKPHRVTAGVGAHVCPCATQTNQQDTTFNLRAVSALNLTIVKK